MEMRTRSQNRRPRPSSEVGGVGDGVQDKRRRIAGAAGSSSSDSDSQKANHEIVAEIYNVFKTLCQEASEFMIEQGEKEVKHIEEVAFLQNALEASEKKCAEMELEMRHKEELYATCLEIRNATEEFRKATEEFEKLVLEVRKAIQTTQDEAAVNEVKRLQEELLQVREDRDRLKDSLENEVKCLQKELLQVREEHDRDRLLAKKFN